MNRSLLAIALINATLLVGCFPDPPGPETGGDGPPTTPSPDAGAGGPDAPSGSSDPHDSTVFKNVIQPMIDTYGCTKSGCHGSGVGSFKVVQNATGADLDANFLAVTKRNDLTAPEKSRVYFKGLNAHAGSQVFSAADAKKFLDWVAAAAAKKAP